MGELLFLDTEWANDSRDLVSLALVNIDGSRRLYVERDPLPPNPSAFVLDVVYPLLDRGKWALPDPAFAAAVRAFVAASNTPRIHFDSPWDKMMLDHAMSEWGRSLAGVPPFVPVLVDRADVRDEVELYFQNTPKALEQRHHAAVDADALCRTYIEVVDP